MVDKEFVDGWWFSGTYNSCPKLQCCIIVNDTFMQFVNQKRSNQNSINRGKQEMGSKVGTRSIAQIAYDLVRKIVTRQIFFVTHRSELVNICFCYSNAARPRSWWMAYCYASLEGYISKGWWDMVHSNGWRNNGMTILLPFLMASLGFTFVNLYPTFWTRIRWKWCVFCMKKYGSRIMYDSFMVIISAM